MNLLLQCVNHVFSKKNRLKKFFRGESTFHTTEKPKPQILWCEKLLKTHVCFSITCQIFAAEKGRGPARSPGASHLEDKQERIKQQIVCF